MMVNVSAAMGAQFAEAVTELSEKIRDLGPNPLRKSQITNHKSQITIKSHVQEPNGGHNDCR